jgi:PII-like signaling protein
MLSPGAARKVTVFINEDAHHHHGSLCDAILNFLLHAGVSGATATRAIAGFGTHHSIHTHKIELLSEHLPIRIEFIESAAKVDELMPALCDMVVDGLVEVQDTTVVKVANRQ